MRIAKSWVVTITAVMTAAWLAAAPAVAQGQQDFPTWLAKVRSEALAHGISPATVKQALAGIEPIDRVLELDRRQPEFTLTYEEYAAQVVNPQRVDAGRQLLRSNRKLLRQVAGKFGVPPAVIVAMWGIETDYGRLTGGFPVVPALATLAYDGRRSQYFRTELMDALQIIDAGIPASNMRGSWAGAMGQCQFMPSTYLKYARRWSGDGAADIWGRRADVFASAANYLSQIGWNRRYGWGRPVKLPKRGVPAAAMRLEVTKSLKEWRRLGVTLPNGKPLPGRSDLRASLIRAETGKGEDVGRGAPYLVYDNFRVLMKWNRSIFFGLAAGTLADRLASK